MISKYYTILENLLNNRILIESLKKLKQILSSNAFEGNLKE